LVDAVPSPLYQQIAEKVQQLRDLGMSDRAIAQALGVDDEAVATAQRCGPSADLWPESPSTVAPALTRGCDSGLRGRADFCSSS